MKRLFGIILVLAGLTGSAVFADSDAVSSLYPVVPKATGAPHPEGNEFMRINHKFLLQHDRDLTLRQGEREIKYSLKECVACHAVNGPDAQPVAVTSEKHFCRVCHDYAAVKVDCFQCHNSKPDPDLKAMMLLPGKSRDLAAYLKGVTE